MFDSEYRINIKPFFYSKCHLCQLSFMMTVPYNLPQPHVNYLILMRFPSVQHCDHGKALSLRFQVGNYNDT